MSSLSKDKNWKDLTPDEKKVRVGLEKKRRKYSEMILAERLEINQYQQEDDDDDKTDDEETGVVPTLPPLKPLPSPPPKNITVRKRKR